MPEPHDEFACAYERTTGTAPTKNGDGYRMPCIHRADKSPSLVALKGNDGGLVLLDNGTPLSAADRITTIKAVGLSQTGGKPKPLPVVDMIPAGRLPAAVGVLGAKVEEEYEYRNAQGWPVFDVVRLRLPNGQKMIRVRRPWSDGTFVWSITAARDKSGDILPEIDPPLYRLPEAMADISGVLCVAEGERKVDRLRALGLCAVCTLGGAGQVKRHAVKVRECAADRRVIIFADNDEAGEKYVLTIARAVAPVAKEVRIVRFHDLPVGHDIVDWLNAGGTKAQLVALVETAEVYRPDVDTDTGKDIVVVNQGMRAAATDEIRDRLRARNTGPNALFMSAGRIAWVREGRVEGLTADQLDWLLDRTFQFVVMNHEKGTSRRIDPPSNVVRMVMADPRPCFPELVGVVTDPFMRPDGSIVAEAGYDEQTRRLLVIPSGYECPSIPAQPTAEHVRLALAVIMELIADFPFDCAASRANAIALLFTLVLRPMLGRTNVPLFLADATKARTGKSLLLQALLMAAFGHTGSWGRLPRTEDEMGKAIMGALMACVPAVCWDNITGLFDYECQCVVLTSPSFSQRWLGRNDASSILVAENNTLFLATGNGCTLGHDLSWRTVWIRLDARCAAPGDRTGFRIADLITYALEHRVRIRAAVLTIARAWFAAGQPSAPMLPTMGGFERWVSVIGSILHFAGVEGFLANAQSMREVASNPADDHSEFVQRLWETCRGEFTARELADKLGHALSPDGRTGRQRDFASTLPDRVGSALGRPTFNNEVGKFLSRIRDSITPGGLVLRLVNKDRNGVAQWRVEFAGSGDAPSRNEDY